MAAARIVKTDAVHCIAYWNNAAIVDVGGDLDPVRMRGIGDAYEALRRSYPKGMIALVIAQPNTPVGSDETRAEGARLLKALGDGLKQILVVIEDRSLLAQLMRSVMRGINVIVRNSRMSTFDTVDDAVRAAAKYIESSLPRAAVEHELSEAVRSVRGSFASSPERVARFNSQRSAARRS